jgi:hypothetical protein
MGTFTKRVVDTNDDGCHSQYGGGWGTGDLFFGESGFGGDYTGGLRFTNVTISQGTTITSAKISMKSYGGTVNLRTKIYGIYEDNTASMSSDPTGRTKTSANTDWDLDNPSSGSTYDTSDITSIVQEIVNRVGWSSGNAMGFLILDDTSSDSSQWYDYEEDNANAALLTIVYSGVSSSASQSRSSSPSQSPSGSLSPSFSQSPSSSPSTSNSPSPSATEPFRGLMKIAKPGYNVLTDQEPHHFIFSSEYGTLKYYQKSTAQITFDANTGDFAGTATVTHDLGYYPYVEVFVSSYIGNPSGVYEYCPFAGSGAAVQYDANYKITTTGITLYAQINGVSTSVWVFDFLIFVYKNNLNL